MNKTILDFLKYIANMFILLFLLIFAVVGYVSAEYFGLSRMIFLIMTVLVLCGAGTGIAYETIQVKSKKIHLSLLFTFAIVAFWSAGIEGIFSSELFRHFGSTLFSISIGTFMIIWAIMIIMKIRGIGILAIIFAATLLIFSVLFPSLIENNFLKNAKQTDAIVEEIRITQLSRRSNAMAYEAIVEYYVDEGKYKSILGYGEHPRFSKGEIITIYYNENNPIKIMHDIKKHFNRIFNYCWSLLFILIGLYVTRKEKLARS
ncbi:MAG: hypothetical protein FWE47_04300 [Oscillospiraceae bacterium]|nr:hypothetical protein [Oscillospiraceae bacterium]